MSKVLKATFPQKCIGCEICVMEVQKQLNKAGLDGSLIKVLRNTDENGNLVFSIDIDPQVNDLDIQTIKKTCPTLVFTIQEEDQIDDFTG